MTVAIAAEFEGGIVCATDSSITYGNNRIALPHIKGQYVLDGFAMYAGTVYVAQRILRRAVEEPLLDVVIDEQEELTDDEENADFLLVNADGMRIIEAYGAEYKQERYAAIGHGGDAARMLMRGMYQYGDERYVTQTVKTVISIIQEFDTTVYGPVRTAVFFHTPN